MWTWITVVALVFTAAVLWSVAVTMTKLPEWRARWRRKKPKQDIPVIVK